MEVRTAPAAASPCASTPHHASILCSHCSRRAALRLSLLVLHDTLNSRPLHPPTHRATDHTLGA